MGGRGNCKPLSSGAVTRLGDGLVRDRKPEKDQSPGVDCYLMCGSPGRQIPQQPEGRLFRKILDPSQPVTDGPLGLRSHLCKMMLTKHTPSCLSSSSAPRWSESIPSALIKRLLCARYCDIRHTPQQDSRGWCGNHRHQVIGVDQASPLHLSSQGPSDTTEAPLLILL